jgi:hypothetical protein
MLVLQPRQCKDMGSDARVALYAPSQLAPYVSLPSSIGGSTGYISTTMVNGTSTWISTVISGCQYLPKSIMTNRRMSCSLDSIDTPSVVTELTNYGAQPTQAVLINANAKPSASTFAAASATTGTGTTTTTSSSTSTSQPGSSATSPAPSNTGLSVAAKAGIGAGVGGGALVAALVVLTVLLCRKRRTQDQTAQLPNQQPYPISPAMPASPYFSQVEKDSWNPSAFSAGSSPPMMSPDFDPNPQSHYPHIVPSLYSDQRSQKPPSISAPMELSADQHVHELHSDQLPTNNGAAEVSDDRK